MGGKRGGGSHRHVEEDVAVTLLRYLEGSGMQEGGPAGGRQEGRREEQGQRAGQAEAVPWGKGVGEGGRESKGGSSLMVSTSPVSRETSLLLFSRSTRR